MLCRSGGSPMIMRRFRAILANASRGQQQLSGEINMKNPAHFYEQLVFRLFFIIFWFREICYYLIKSFIVKSRRYLTDSIFSTCFSCFSNADISIYDLRANQVFATISQNACWHFGWDLRILVWHLTGDYSILRAHLKSYAEEQVTVNSIEINDWWRVQPMLENQIKSFFVYIGPTKAISDDKNIRFYHCDNLHEQHFDW